MAQPNLIAAGVGGLLALVLLYLNLRVRLVASSGGGGTRAVSETEYVIARLNAWTDFSLSAMGRMGGPVAVFIAPVVAILPDAVATGSGDFAWPAYLYALLLMAPPTLIVARRAFTEAGHRYAMGDLKLARREAAKTNRSIFLASLLSAALYAILVWLALLIIGAAWWVHVLVLLGVVVASFFLMIGLSD